MKDEELGGLANRIRQELDELERVVDRVREGEHEEDITVVFADGTKTSAKAMGREASSHLAILKLKLTTRAVAQPSHTPAVLGQIALRHILHLMELRQASGQ